jgi:L-seryl-tRNA(Ser) seleniumtransferase
MEEIPTLQMLMMDTRSLKKRGRRLLKRLSGRGIQRMAFTLKEDVSQVGGGALPLQELRTIVVAIKPLDFSVNQLEEKLRKGNPPIISRISKEELILDMRTVFDEEIPLLASGIEKALNNLQPK